MKLIKFLIILWGVFYREKRKLLKGGFVKFNRRARIILNIKDNRSFEIKRVKIINEKLTQIELKISYLTLNNTFDSFWLRKTKKR